MIRFEETWVWLLKELDVYCGIYETRYQAQEGVWGIPWHWKAKKDVLCCEKLRGVARER